MKYLCRCFRFWPFVLSIGAPISFFITYGLAVGSDHVSAFWPYISDTGTTPPESCVFGVFLNTFAFSLSVVVYLKYRLVSEWSKICESEGIQRRWNRLSAAFGYISCFGLMLVANFEETSQILIHITGAILAFCFGIGYSALQTAFGYRMDPAEKRIFWLRVFLTIFCVVCVAAFLGPIAPALAAFEGKDYLKWSSKDGGFPYHLTSTLFEWFMMFAYCAFFYTIYLDFRKVEILPPQIQFLHIHAKGKIPKGTIDKDELDIVVTGVNAEEISQERSDSPSEK